MRDDLGIRGGLCWGSLGAGDAAHSLEVALDRRPQHGQVLRSDHVPEGPESDAELLRHVDVDAGDLGVVADVRHINVSEEGLADSSFVAVVAWASVLVDDATNLNEWCRS